MATKTITSANAVYTLGVLPIYPQPQTLQGYSADDMFDTETVAPAVAIMGMDGKLSAGFVYAEVKQTIALQADSPSIDLFERWMQAQKVAKEVFYAFGLVTLPATGRKYTLTQGVLTNYVSISGAKKTLQPRVFSITWQDVSPAPF